MTKKIIAIVVLIIILLAAFFVRDKFTKEVEEQDKVTTEEQESLVMETLDVKHQYKDGEHIFVGNFNLPTPCHSFNASVENPNEDPNNKERILKIDMKEPEDGQVCAETVTERSYKIIHKGPEDLTFRVFLNDQEYRLNIFEIPEHIDIDQFQIYLKG